MNNQSKKRLIEVIPQEDLEHIEEKSDLEYDPEIIPFEDPFESPREEEPVPGEGP